jgi:hypothetical protein
MQRTLDGTRHDLATAVLKRRVIDDAMAQKRPILHQSEHMRPPRTIAGPPPLNGRLAQTFTVAAEGRKANRPAPCGRTSGKRHFRLARLRRASCVLMVSTLIAGGLSAAPLAARQRVDVPRLAATGMPRAAVVPMPRPRPAHLRSVPAAIPQIAAPEQLPRSEEPLPGTGPQPRSACRQRLEQNLAGIHPLPDITGPGACIATDVVRLEAVFTVDARKILLEPAAVLRCGMAEAVVHWLRDEAAPAADRRGAPVVSLITAASFECRGRNRVNGAKLSQHGLANALDIRALKLADGTMLTLTDPEVPKQLRARLQETACTRFTTVLGPGSDGYHEDHVHLDLTERRGGYRICQWDIREPGAKAEVLAAVPSFAPLTHLDGSAPGTIAPPLNARLPGRAEGWGSCRSGPACPRAASPRRAPVPRHAAAPRSVSRPASAPQ